MKIRYLIAVLLLVLVDALEGLDVLLRFLQVVVGLITQSWWWGLLHL
jgi:hypothetical protein